MRFDLQIDLSTHRQLVLSGLEQQAERHRAMVLTAGIGQAVEYGYTEAEVNEIGLQHRPIEDADYPFLASERNAQIAAGNADFTLADAAQLCQGRINAVKTYLAGVKEARRTAKLKILAAASVADIDAIMAAVKWPTLA